MIEFFAILLSIIALFFTYTQSKIDLFIRFLPMREEIYFSLNSAFEENFSYNSLGVDCWGMMEDDGENIECKIRKEEKDVLDALERAKRYFPSIKKDVEELSTLLRSYRMLHLERTGGSESCADRDTLNERIEKSKESLINKWCICLSGIKKQISFNYWYIICPI